MPFLSDDREEERIYCCLFCRTGSEEETARQIERIIPSSEVVVATKLRLRRVDGNPVEERVSLFPGYLFVRMGAQRRPFVLLHRHLILRILLDSEGDWRLKGRDLAFAEGLFRTGGVVGFSRAYYVNDRIHAVEGPLAGFDGQITRVNRRKRTAEVQMDFQGVQMRVWLGFELIEPEDAPAEEAADAEISQGSIEKSSEKRYDN